MNEMNNSAMDLTSLGVALVITLVGLLVWFFINRASVRANQQIALLESLLDEQKRQNALLLRLTEKVVGKEQPSRSAEAEGQDFTRLIPER